MLEIKNLYAKVDDKEILKGLNLTVNKGETHAIMGPNGSGKSTLANIIAGKEGYKITQGDILYNGSSILEMSPEERAWNGIFLAFQYPVEIPGVNNVYLLKAALNASRKYRGEPPLDAVDFLRLVKEKIQLVKMKEEFLNRSVNEGFSGGEKKRNEIFQMAMLEPKLGILDETDSGLDIDALRVVSEGVNCLLSKERSFILVTHYTNLLNYVKPDYIHVLSDGKIVKTGDANLAVELEEKGYTWIKEVATT